MKHRILVVDDSRELTEAVSILLARDGHECRVANSGLQALDEARRFGPDIVILDIGLPGMSGYDVAHALRAEVARPLHLAAMTGRGSYDLEQARAFDQRVMKPIDAAALRTIVHAAERAGSA